MRKSFTKNVSNPEIMRRPCRDRLIASLAVATGMRLDECANLTLSQYKNLKKDGSYSNVALPLYKTKGLKPRTVVVPGIIHDDLRHYVKTERARAVRRAKTSVEALFVNHAHAKRNPGEAMTAHSIWRHFQRGSTPRSPAQLSSPPSYLCGYHVF